MRLKDFDTKDTNNILSTNERYKVSVTGEIYDIPLKKQLEISGVVESEVYYTILADDGKNYLLKHSVIMALAFKRPYFKPSKWPFLDVMYIDGDKTNIHPGNLVWKFPENGIEDDGLEGFRHIPGYSRYLINKIGMVYNRAEKKIMHISMREGIENAYPSVHIKPDRFGKVVTARLHRVLALAFIPYTANVDKLDVNHLDGNKKNYSLDNLEWSTRGKNCTHAYEAGLREDNIPIQIKNVYTGEVFEFYSDNDCNQYFGLKLGASRYRSKSRGQKIFDYGVLIREKGCDIDWLDITTGITERTYKDTRQIPVEITDEKTGISKVYNTIDEASENIGIPPSSIRYFLKKNPPGKPVYGYILKYADLEALNKSFFDEIRKKKTPLIAGNSR